jgi:hypothetical protein
VLVLSTSTGICYCFDCIGGADVLKEAETNFQADYNVLTLSTDDKRLLEGMRIGTRDEHDEP